MLRKAATSLHDLFPTPVALYPFRDRSIKRRERLLNLLLSLRILIAVIHS